MENHNEGISSNDIPKAVGQITSSIVAAQLERLAREFRVTAGTRFRAEKKFEDKDNVGNIVIPLSLGFLLIYTILPRFFETRQKIVVILDALTVSLSVILLVASFLQNKNEFNVKARIMKWSALELNELAKETLVAANNPSSNFETIARILGRRSMILSKV